MEDFSFLPFIFAGLMGISILIYVVLDGFDLGIGILFPFAKDAAHEDRMVATIGPFWDANETWLVLAVGLLLVAFPIAHGVVLQALYLPVFILLIGLIFRGVAFEFRAKADDKHKQMWNNAFWIGSLMASLAQGFMLGIYIMGLHYSAANIAFACLVAVGLSAAYALIGAGWLIIKTEGPLHNKAVGWAKKTLWLSALAMAAISIASPLNSARIFDKWFEMPNILFLAPIPLLSAFLFYRLWRSLYSGSMGESGNHWKPFAYTAGMFMLAFIGLAWSFFPYVVPEKLTIWEAAAAPSSLVIILIGALLVLPMILGYTALSYYVFRGKATGLDYH